MKLITLTAVLLLSGCANVDPYASIGLGYQVDSASSHDLRTTRPWQCSSNVQVHGELGLDLPKNWSVAYHHQSWLACGRPFNNRRELSTDDIRITKTFGGRK